MTEDIPPIRLAIVGGGISGLATAYWLRLLEPDYPLCILDKSPVAGGKLRSTVQDGFTFDWAANGFLDSAPDTLELVRQLGLSGALQPAASSATSRFVYHDGGLRELPNSPQAFLKSELLSPLGKARAALELVRGRAGDEEESVYAFLRRHFGREVADTFAELAVTGVSAGDAKQLSLDALFPRFRTLEREHGSLLRALQKARPTGGRLHSFRAGGVGRLSSALAEALGDALIPGAEVAALAPVPEGYRLELASGESLEAERVVLATPAFVSAGLLEPFSPGAAQLLGSIPYADVGVFGLGYDRIDVPRDLSGFGFLVPRGEGVRSLGVLWSSALFPDQAPEGKVMLRVIVGGALEPDFLELSDEEALEVVRRDLRLSMGITAEPELVAYMRWPQGIPQYHLGHQAKVRTLQSALSSQPGLYVTGNALGGVGVNDCIRAGRQLARELAQPRVGRA